MYNSMCGKCSNIALLIHIHSTQVYILIQSKTIGFLSDIISFVLLKQKISIYLFSRSIQVVLNVCKFNTLNRNHKIS